MKKLSRTQLILIAAIVALLVVNVIFATGYLGAVSRKADLESDIEDKEAQIASMQVLYNIDALNRQLAEAERQLAEEAPFPQEIKTTDMARSIDETARQADITCYQFNPGAVSTTTVGGNTYSVKPYAIAVTKPPGERLSRIINFLRLIEELREEQYKTLKINNIELTDYAKEGIWNLEFNIEVIIR